MCVHALAHLKVSVIYYCCCYSYYFYSLFDSAQSKRVSEIMFLLFCGVQRHCLNWYRFEPYIILVNTVQLNNSKLSGSRVRVYLSVSLPSSLFSMFLCDLKNSIISSAWLGFFLPDYIRMHCLH